MIQQNKSKRIWYDEPALDWEKDALPLGNGRLGVMFFGGIEEEILQFNEETLYSGCPEEVKEKAYIYLDEIRECLKRQDYLGAQEIMDEKYLEKAAYGHRSNFGAYQNFGTISIKFEHGNEISEYIRELNIEEAIGRVSYSSGKCNYTRQYFVSHPDNCLVGRITADQVGAINAVIEMSPGLENGKVFCKQNRIILEQTTGYLKCEAIVEIINCGGSVVNTNEGIVIQNANELLFFLTAATEYKEGTPNYKGNSYREINRDILKDAVLKPYYVLQKRHIADYQQLFNRFTLKIGDHESLNDTTIPTDILLEQYKEGKESRWLETLIFDYARYLLISSSRENTLPANLQGIWNNSNNPEWGSIFCYNINLNMNYWMAQSTNLKECHIALIRFIDSLRESGRRSAKAYFNARGWFASKKSDVWGYTKPYASGVYGYFVAGSAWLCQDVWEYFDYTRDEKYLENVAYPILEEAVLFYLDFLTVNEQGKYVANPSASPENAFVYEGKNCWLTEGTEINHRIIEQLFRNYLNCCKILNKTGVIRESAENIVSRIASPELSKEGMIQEWDKDFEESEPQHRHISFSYGVYPGKMFDMNTDFEVIRGVEKLMNRRGDDSTGWSRVWKSAVWARLKKGNRSFKILQNFIRNSLYPNLFSICPPFQIDANFGYAAAVMEMIINDDGKTITLLPALPESWKDGSVTGICLRGGMEISFEWQNGQVISYHLNRKNMEKQDVIINVNGKDQEA